jgi:hypothetical protein
MNSCQHFIKNENMDTQNSEHEKTLLGTLLHCLLVTVTLFFCMYLWKVLIIIIGNIKNYYFLAKC